VECLKSLDKIDEEIIKSLMYKTKMTVLLGREKRHDSSAHGFLFVVQTLLQSGLMAMEPQTGNIKAWVGGSIINISNTIT
jgi:penicillin-binding protein 1A